MNETENVIDTRAVSLYVSSRRRDGACGVGWDSGGNGGSLDTPRIRLAEPADLPDLTGIYNHYVATTHITFDTEPFTADQRRPWFRQFSGTGPHRLFVAEVAAQPAGYASSAGFRAKPAYHTSVETTVYLHPDFIGRGIGRSLYSALLDSLEDEKSVHRAYGGVALPNKASVALHESLGFTPVGTFREVGWKFEKYWDVRWYEKAIADLGSAQDDEGRASTAVSMGNA